MVRSLCDDSVGCQENDYGSQGLIVVFISWCARDSAGRCLQNVHGWSPHNVWSLLYCSIALSALDTSAVPSWFHGRSTARRFDNSYFRHRHRPRCHCRSAVWCSNLQGSDKFLARSTSRCILMVRISRLMLVLFYIYIYMYNIERYIYIYKNK
jgi:hypothetical protein